MPTVPVQLFDAQAQGDRDKDHGDH
jgi:host factor-I protein